MAKTPVAIQIRGTEEVARAMQKLTKASSVARVVRPGVTKAGRVVRKAAKSLAPRGKAPLEEGRKRLYQALISKVKSYKSGNVVAIVGPDRKKKAFHGVLVELGTTERQTKSGANRGSMPAFYFLDRALRQTAAQQFALVRADIPEQVDKEVKRVAVRAAKKAGLV